jgi:hypothetical protein
LVNSGQRHDPAEIYISRLSQVTVKIQATRKRMKRLAFLRLIIFLATFIMVVVATRWNMTAIFIILLAGISAFIFTVIRYLALQRQNRKDENLADINENELKALQGNFSMFDDGDEFNEPDHPFADDLDILGRQGIFQFVNRSATSLGKSRLAQWFLHPFTDPELIGNQQEAVREMSAKLDFRQEFLATGYLEKDSPADKADLLAWVSEEPEFSHKKFSFYLVFVPLLTFTVLFLVIFSYLSPVWILLYLAVPFGLTGSYLKKINRKYQMLSKKSDLLKEYSGLLALMEKEDFASPKMALLKKNLMGKGGMPSDATRKLSVILDAFDARNNMLMGFLLNFLFLWDILQVRRTERWQAMHREDLPRWLEVLADADAICSLAGFHFNHPGSIFPGISADGAILNAKSLGHPLVLQRDRVDNPALVPAWQHFTIITGANMAGKSTYLRTVGVNLVMAMTGSAVIAEEMSIYPGKSRYKHTHKRFAAEERILFLRRAQAAQVHHQPAGGRREAVHSARRDPQRHQLPRQAKRFHCTAGEAAPFQRLRLRRHPRPCPWRDGEAIPRKGRQQQL